jgi:hypothetical protein
MLRGQPSGYDSTSDEDQEAHEIVLGPRIHYFILIEERESLISIGKRLIWCDRISSQGGVDSPRRSGFRVAIRRRYFGLSFVHVLRLAPGS